VNRTARANIDLEVSVTGVREPDARLIHLWTTVAWEANAIVIGPPSPICEVAELPRIGSRASIINGGIDVEIVMELVVFSGPQVSEQTVCIAAICS
jgi:hypothetical protein